MTESRYTIVLGDDHHLMVEALRTALSANHHVVAVAYTATEILAAVRDHCPDLLLLDLSLPERNGLELIPEVRMLSPRTRIVVVTMHLDRLLAERALAAGAGGFLPKDAGLEELEGTMRAVMGGATSISPRVPTSLNPVALTAAHAALVQLTPRQHEIIRLIAKGLTSQDIASRLGLSERTIAFHRANIRTRLGVDSTLGLMRYAVLLQLNQMDSAGARPAETGGVG